MLQITVGQAAGIIAAAIFIARLWAPSGLTLILSGLLNDSNSATTWTVSASAFQRSLWPAILRSDSSQNHGVRTEILLVTNLVTWTSLLIALAGIITPLGLYDALVPIHSVQATFQYLPDKSPFGLGTPPRSNLPFSRLCSDGFEPCPFSDTVLVDVLTSNGSSQSNFPYGYNTSIPQIIMDIYSSGTEQNTTVSNFFDIQWRRYYMASGPKFDNDSAYLISGFRSMQSLVTNDKVQVVEGLVVDMVNGSVGFRNHTFPPGFQHGATWSEDLLFVEPETVCVNTNLTIDYNIAPAVNGTTIVSNLVLTDRGGFVNLNHTYPAPNITNPQANPDLWTRAYTAAWLNNAYSALYYNVTDDNNHTSGRTAFSYMNSAVNKTFQLPLPGNTADAFLALMITQNFGDFLGIDGGNTALPNATDPASTSQPINPFNIQVSNFSDIDTYCAASSGADFANITNIFVMCGLIHGAPQRQDTGNSLIFESGSEWSQPLYACASAIKATIKTVSFSYNGTDNSLEDLTVTSIEDKAYAVGEALPIWGVENTGNAYTTSDLELIWGLVSDEYASHENISTVRQNSLYLPGYSGDAFLQTAGLDYMPGAEAFLDAMSPSYTVETNIQEFASFAADTVDYTGIMDISMLVRWQYLSQSAELASQIPNLIWADVAASAVVGTKGVLGPGNTATENIIPILVTPIVSQVKYHWPYAIPAFLVALILLIITIMAIIFALFGHHSIAKLRLNLQKASTGRILTAFLFQNEPNGMTMASKDWAKGPGKTMIDLSGDCPKRGAGTLEDPEKSPQIFDNQYSGPTHHSEEIRGEGEEEADGQQDGQVDGPAEGQRFLSH